MYQKQNPLKRFLSIRGMGQVVTVTVGLIVLCAVFAFLNDMFLSGRNLHNLSRQIVPILLVGIGQSFVLITANIDLSIGSVVGMSCMISSTLMTKGTNPWLASLMTLVACLVIGIVNGLLVSKCKLPPFIATLGTMTIGRGIAQIANNNYNTDSIGEGAQSFRDFFYYGFIGRREGGTQVGVYSAVLIALVLWVVFFYILERTRTGRHLYAIGSNIDASRMSGVNVDRTTCVAYLVSAFCACIVGLMTTATSGMGSMDSGNMYEMYAVAASVIGGVSTLGGQGLLLGTVIGAAIWGVLQNGLQFAGAPVAIRNIIIGVIVIVSVLMDVVVRFGWGRRKKKAA